MLQIRAPFESISKLNTQRKDDIRIGERLPLFIYCKLHLFFIILCCPRAQNNYQLTLFNHEHQLIINHIKNPPLMIK